MKFQVEVVWNREFEFVRFGPLHDNRSAAILFAQEALDSGDGERVKKARVVDEDGTVAWPKDRMHNGF